MHLNLGVEPIESLVVSITDMVIFSSFNASMVAWKPAGALNPRTPLNPNFVYIWQKVHQCFEMMFKANSLEILSITLGDWH
jgi:hypothetical protein